MLAIRVPSATRAGPIPSCNGMTRGLLARESSESRADRHTDAGEITLAEHVAGHNLAGRPDIVGRATILQDHLRTLVYDEAEIRERDAGAQRVGEERRRVEPPRPVRLRR